MRTLLLASACILVISGPALDQCVLQRLVDSGRGDDIDAARYGIKPTTFEKIDIHVHIPEGATPKDGPSAGVAMCTSIISVLTGIAVRSSVAMTGEITLRGRVLPIDGLKEKLLAALRGGIKTVIIPKENERNLSEIPNDVRRGINIITAATVDEALQYALVEQPEPIDWPEKEAVEAISSGSADKEIKGVVTH